MRSRDERGVVFPSPVVMLSIIAVAMAAVAFVATQGAEPTEREVTTVARTQTPTPSPSASAPATQKPKPQPKPKPEPVVKRGKTYVEVYNNSGITGLAGTVATRVTDAGWQVVGTDNWYGTVAGNTVFYPRRLEAEAELLALDLGIDRTAVAVDPMRLDRLTVIMTGELG